MSTMEEREREEVMKGSKGGIDKKDRRMEREKEMQNFSK